MQKYRRVAYEDRCHISALLQANYSIQEISEALGFHKSSIYRELKRNSKGQTYCPQKATQKAFKRFKLCRRKKLIDTKMRECLMAYLSFGWSPEQISGRLKREKNISLSYQTIYRNFPKRQRGRAYMRRFGKRGAGRLKQKRRSESKKVFIDKRPKIVEQRRRLGDWERDGMYGANRKQLLVFTERKSRFTKVKKMETGKSSKVKELTQSTLTQLGKRVFTVTNDNGSEFNDTALLPFKVYHCKAYKPQQRGTVENTIGLLRQYIKRSTDLDSLTNKDLFNLENKINFRPRKCLEYKTPFEVFFNKKVALVV